MRNHAPHTQVHKKRVKISLGRVDPKDVGIHQLPLRQPHARKRNVQMTKLVPQT